MRARASTARSLASGQTVRHLILDQGIEGSNPSSPAKFRITTGIHPLTGSPAALDLGSSDQRAGGRPGEIVLPARTGICGKPIELLHLRRMMPATERRREPRGSSAVRRPIGSVARLVPQANGETDLGRRRDLLIMRRLIKRFAVAVSMAALVLSLSVSATIAGEVKGPSTGPGVHNTNTTGALDHANSICAASGLNDYDPAGGQTVSRVQTAADSWKYYSLPKGSVGTWGLCKGGTGE